MVSWRWKLLCPSVAALAVAAAQYACSETGPDADPRVNGCLTEGCLEAGTTGEGGPTDGGTTTDGPPIVYPDPLEGTTKTATRVIGNRGFVEGPVWIGGRLLFTDIPANVILELSGTGTTNFRTNSGGTNGLAVDSLNRLLMCEGSRHQITRSNGTAGSPANLLYDRFNTRRLNSPNDVVVRADNTIYFTDPNYGAALPDPDNQLPYQGAYYIDKLGALVRIDGTFNKANGIGLSPDGNTLYIVDNGAGKLLSAPVAADGKPGTFTEIADVPGGDGMAVDDAGNLYVADDDGIDVFDKTGARKIGTITVVGKASNCTFGGADRKTLFITSNSAAIPGVDGGPATNNPATGLYSLELKVPGLP